VTVDERVVDEAISRISNSLVVGGNVVGSVDTGLFLKKVHKVLLFGVYRVMIVCTHMFVNYKYTNNNCDKYPHGTVAYPTWGFRDSKNTVVNRNVGCYVVFLTSYLQTRRNTQKNKEYVVDGCQMPGRNIFIVENDRTIASAITLYLEDAGCILCRVLPLLVKKLFRYGYSVSI